MGYRKLLFYAFINTAFCDLEKKYPNIILLLADDLGIGDVGCYGNDTINTPNIDSIGNNGVKFTHHLAAAALCTPSRAALLTSRYPARYGFVGDEGFPPVIVHVASNLALPFSEITLPEVLKVANYSTAIVGKWHLGSHCQLFGHNCYGPLLHGFDTFYGLPLSLIEECKGGEFISLSKISPWMHSVMNCIVMKNTTVVEQPLILDGLSQRLIDYSIDFINESTALGKHFFLYHSFAHVHTPMFLSSSFKGRSLHGRYGDNVEEMDEGIGHILSILEQLNLIDNTIVIFASDHGGHLEAIGADGQREGGYNRMFKGGKGMGGVEGGIRIPAVMQWPKQISAGQIVSVPTSLMDIMPTLLELIGLPAVHEIYSNISKDQIDGISIASMLKGYDDYEQNGYGERALFHFCRSALHSVRIVKDLKVYKVYFVRHKWNENSTQCGWGVNNYCGCFGDAVANVFANPIVFELYGDPYEDMPLSTNTTEYAMIVEEAKNLASKWYSSVNQTSLFADTLDCFHNIFKQPFKSLF